MLVSYLSIKPCASVVGEYEAYQEGDEVLDDADLLNSCEGEVYELGAEDLPAWVEDIRGRIRDEPARVFVERSADEQLVRYFGLNPF